MSRLAEVLFFGPRPPAGFSLVARCTVRSDCPVFSAASLFALPSGVIGRPRLLPSTLFFGCDAGCWEEFDDTLSFNLLPRIVLGFADA